ncbi:hypothetical protein [Polycladidibacter hongkongensis]|uniref:hypothetical protein n=1 Tax=Polycladidibacter hongkongensis TaxID=1647556 RepID=UPI00082FDA86|nr:hypothetical protein [Pseudovibrio hongkongensis]
MSKYDTGVSKLNAILAGTRVLSHRRSLFLSRRAAYRSVRSSGVDLVFKGGRLIHQKGCTSDVAGPGLQQAVADFVTAHKGLFLDFLEREMDDTAAALDKEVMQLQKATLH